MNNNLKNHILSVGVSRRHVNAKLSDFDFKINLESEKGLFITGPVGTGKTHLMSAIAAYYAVQYLKDEESYDPGSYAEKPQNPLFVSFTELLFELKKSYSSKESDAEDYLLRKYSNCKILFLDDLGAEKVSEWSTQLLLLLIDRRYSNMQKTFISSNLMLKDISKNLDDRIASRICQMCDVLKLSGNDKRAMTTV